jgi:hypothetical protein
MADNSVMNATVNAENAAMRNIIHAALIYFAAVFSLAFVLGALRVTLIAPKVGAIAAVALELPVVLTASWRASAYATRCCHIAPREVARLQMGALAFVVLMGVEMMMSVFVFNQPVQGDFLTGMLTPHGILGLAGQMAFGFIPWIQCTQHAKTRSK